MLFKLKEFTRGYSKIIPLFDLIVEYPRGSTILKSGIEYIIIPNSIKECKITILKNDQNSDHR